MTNIDPMTTESERVEEAIRVAWVKHSFLGSCPDDECQPIRDSIHDAVLPLIEKARREERERCAKKAEAGGCVAPLGSKGPCGECLACKIAASIRQEPFP